MIFSPVTITLKDGRQCILRPASISDGPEMLAFRKTSVAQTDFLLQYPEELADYTIEKQLNFITRMIDNPHDYMFTAVVDGRIAGTGQVSFNSRIKMKHRASIGIALLKEYWGLGIGSGIFTQIIRTAEQKQGVTHLELQVIEGNDRAMALYRKFGFETVAELPDAIRLKDGTMLKEITMVKKL